MLKAKSFLDTDININEKLFASLKINDIVSWSHLKLWSAMQNVPADYSFFTGILVGASVFNKLYDIILKAINTTNFLDEYIAKIETIEIIEKLYIVRPIWKPYKAQEFWLKLADIDASEIAYAELKTLDKYKLFNAIFKKNPLIMVKFFNKHKNVLHEHDIDFEVWLRKYCKLLAKHNALFKKIYAALVTEIENLNVVSMHLN